MPRMSRVKSRRFNRKRTNNRRRANKMVSRRVSRNVHYFKRKVVLGNVQAYNSGGVGTNAATAFSFKLSDLPQYTDFTSLFEQYKLTGVKLDFIPFADNISWEVASNGASIAAPGGPLLVAVDFDDASAPATASEMLSRQDVKVIPVGRRYQVYLRPKFMDNTNASTATPSTGYIDCDTPNSLHYGVKCWMSAPNVTNSNFTYQVWATYYIKCKGVI